MILTRATGGKALLVLEVFCNPVRDVFACFWGALFPNKIPKLLTVPYKLIKRDVVAQTGAGHAK